MHLDTIHHRCSHRPQLFLVYLYFFVVKVEQTWEKSESLQHPPLLAEIHHQVTHVVTGFSLQGEAKGWSHCHAADKERHTQKKHTNTREWKRARSVIQTGSEAKIKKTGDSNTAR